MANEFKFQPSKISEAVNKKLVIKRLPEWMQNLEQIQMFFDDAIQPWFTPEEQELFDGYVGDRGSPAAAGKIFLTENDTSRQEYQFSPAYISTNQDKSIRSLQFYPDLVGLLGNNGSLTDNESRLLGGKYYSWTPPINPNKIQNFSSYFWDTQNEYGIDRDYIVMERGALNGNNWSLQNFWYTIGQDLPDGTTLTETLAQSNRFVRALVPIIEYNKNIELVNYGTRFRGVVDYFSDIIKPEDIIQKRITDDVRIDGNLLQAGDRVLFTSIGNNGENNRIYKVYLKTMEDNTKVFGLALDEDEQNESRPTGEPHTGDSVLILKGATYANYAFYWNGSLWTQAQQKTGINASPSFVLYDRNGNKLNDSTKYPGSDFTGSSLFGLKINYNYGEDKIYGQHVELSDLNYYVYDNFLQTTRYNYLRQNVSTPISGFYFYNVINENSESELVSSLKTDWVRSENDSVQYVRQVFNVEKNSMFKVFSTLYEMNNFESPIQSMYGYVIETDTNYQYIKKTSSSNYAWNQISTDAIVSDVYVNEFELAQKIIHNTDLIEVYVDGEQLFNTSFTTTLTTEGKVDSVTITDTSAFTDDTIIVIRTYSKTEVPNKDMGSYEIPDNLKNNAMNGVIDYVHSGLYTTHFQEVIRKNITSGSINDTNDYEIRLANGEVDNSVSTQIIQNEASLLPLMLSTANENLNLFDAIMYNQSEYFRFKNRFNNTMVQLYNANTNTFLAKSATILVDEILTKLSIGKTSDFPFAINLVGSSTTVVRTYIPATPQFLGILSTHKPQKAVYMHVGKDVGCYNVDHTGVVSKAYAVNNQVTLMDDIIYELETRIYDSIDNEFKDVDYVPVLNEDDIKPSAYSSTEYSSDEFVALSLRGYINFIATNGIDSTTHDYDASNWKTWNFSGSNYVINGEVTDKPARGSWRAIYTDMYGTYRPHTNPWEMLGFSQRPEWFNTTYKMSKIQIGAQDSEYINVYDELFTNENGVLVSNGLWDSNGVAGDLSTGTIKSGSRAGTYSKYKHFGVVPFTIESTGEFANNGEEIKVVVLKSPVELGMINGALSHLAEPWKFGDMGEMEFAYTNTPLYSFDRALTLLRAKPAKFANYYYDTKNSSLKSVESGDPQFQYGESNSRLDFSSSTLVHSEDSNRVLGYQMWIADNLISENRSVITNYGDILRKSSVNIGHRLGGYSKAENLTFKSDSFGLVSQENQKIGLVKSSVYKETVLSSLQVTWTGDGYAMNGFDLVNAEFNIQNPNKTARRTTVSSEKLSVVHYSEFLDSYTTYEYGTLLKTPQEVYNFIRGYGEYLENDGWIFEDVDSTGEVYNWDKIAKSYLDWARTTKDRGDYLTLSPSTASAKFGSNFGSILSVTQYSGGVWSLLDSTGKGIRPTEIDTSRIGNVFNVRLDDDSTKQMSLIRLNLISFEHAVIFDNTTIFGDSIYLPTYGAIHEMLKLYGYITGSWNGRLEAPGFMVLESGTLPNFEKLTNDFTNYYDNINPTDNTDINNLSRHLIGFQSRDYLREMITSESSQVDFYKGFIREKGTKQSFEKVLRVSKTYKTENYKALEEWAFKIGTYGNINGKKHLQFQLINNEIKQNPQLFIFDANATDSTSDNNTIKYFGANGTDARWITRPNGNFSFPMRSGISNNIRLPNIGPVTTDEVDIVTKDFSTINAERTKYSYTYSKQPSTAWVLRDVSGNWNIFNVVNTGLTINSITVNESESEDSSTFCTVTLSGNHTMNSGDYYFFIDESGFMPDMLSTERQYYTSTQTSNSFIIPLELVNDITFDDVKPVLYVYKSKFSTDDDKTAYVSTKYEYQAPDTTLFERPSTYNSLTNVPDTNFNIYDPINGVIPGSLMREITYTTSVDPARFNVYAEESHAWGSEHVGEVWWDTTNAFFIDYTRAIYNSDGTIDTNGTLQYKRNNWGKLLPDAEINVYEWVRSPVSPIEWDKYCTRQQRLSKDSTAWVPSGTANDVDWSQFEEWDESTETYKTYYYFWVQNAIYLPKIASRNKTVNEIARCIQDPNQLNVPWISPIDSNSFIINSPQTLVTDDKSILTITYQENSDEVIKHEQFQLCKEGMDYNFNPNIWNSLFNSLTCEEVIDESITNIIQYPSTVLGSEPNKTWFKDVIEARRELVSSMNSIYKTLNITTDTVIMDSVFNVKTENVNPNQIQFKVVNFNNEYVVSVANKVFVENDTVIVSTTGTLPSPLSASDVYFVHVTDEGYIKFMRSPSSDGSAITITLTDLGVGKHNVIKQSDYIASLGTDLDMTLFWSLTDWYSDGYSASTEYTTETSTDIADQKNYQEGDCIRVTGSDGVWTLYVKTFSRNKILWQAVGRQNSTIAMNEKLYSGYSQYNADGSTTAIEKNIRSAINLLKTTFDTVQSRLVFDMVKYVHVEQNVVDWVFKTSYIFVVGLEQPLQRDYLEQDDLINQIVAYFEEVKPYRTKIRSQIEQKTSDEDEINGVSNDLGPNGYVYTDGTWVKSESDIWDYEYAEYDDVEGKYLTVGSLPSGFTTPQRPFQESNEVLVFDNVQCTPDTMTSVLDLEAVDKKYKSQSSDILSTGEHYKLQRFKFTLPTYNASQVESEIMYALADVYDFIDTTVNLSTALISGYTHFDGDIDGTEEFTATVESISKGIYESASDIQEMIQYAQYNTLSNRLKLYTSKSDSTISYDVNCPFKGLVLSDNPSTKLPFGFSAESDMNKGYILKSKDLYEEYKEKVISDNPSFSTEEINAYLIYEYGIYPWVYDLSENGKSYSDTYIVLAAMLNNYVNTDTDPYEMAKVVLDNPTLDSYCMVIIPRKYVSLKNSATQQEYTVPMETGLDEFMESSFIKGNEFWEMAEISMDDLPVDSTNALYSEVLSTMTTSKDSNEYVDDMNSFDNLALESQYKTVKLLASSVVNDVQDPTFIDISDINPEGRNISQIKFTVDGYNFDTAGNIALKDFGTFQIEGLVVQNPYNRKEVLVSIPRYEEAMQYLDKLNFNRAPIQYINKVSAVINTTGTVSIKNTNLKVGDTVAVFVSENEDYYEAKFDNTYVKILSIDSIKENNRPKLFTISSISGDNVSIDGLIFDNIYSNANPEFRLSEFGSSISVVRVGNFNDADFKLNEVSLYSNSRKYSVSAIDYDVFYDRTIDSPSFVDEEYDVWYTSNESTTLGDVEVDHGFYMPIYAKGALSELVRCVGQESLQMFVYEYDADVIKPVFDSTNSVWTYSYNVVDSTYIDSVPASMTFMYQDLDKNYVGTPEVVEVLQIKDNQVLNENIEDEVLLSVNSEIIKIRNNFMSRGVYHSVERNYEAGTTNEVLSVIYGKEIELGYYSSGFDVIPSEFYSTGYQIQDNIEVLLKQK